jgi:coenzyme F420-0:L-glutamate ligase/coenzyme F420-1:gamma-L-glutamate ligase
MPSSSSIRLTAVPGLPLISPGDDLPRVIANALRAARIPLADCDVVVVAQKIVSKAEGRYIDLASITPSVEAESLAAETLKDPRHVQAILDESRRVVRRRPNALVVEHRLGFVMANAGIDQSNIDPNAAIDPALLLPEDPDASAERLRSELSDSFSVKIAVIVSDSFGRPFRLGAVGVALGAAGIPALIDMRGVPDLTGRVLRATEVAFADEIASAASLLMGQADEGRPVVVLQGLTWHAPHRPAAALLRRPDEDMFR